MDEKKTCSMTGPAPDSYTGDMDSETTDPAMTREQILQVKDDAIMPVPVPEWGGTVYVRTIMAGEYDDFESELVTTRKGKDPVPNLTNYRARFAAMVICDENGEKLFTKSDIAALTRKSRAAMDRVMEAGKKLNRISDKDEDELVANLGKTPDEDS